MPLTDREWDVFLRMTEAGRLSAADIAAVTGIPLDEVEHALADGTRSLCEATPLDPKNPPVLHIGDVKNPPELYAGDVVKLNSGGPWMTINGPSLERADLIECAWFEIGVSDVCSGLFHRDALTLQCPDPSIKDF